MRLNGLGMYQSNTLSKPRANSTKAAEANGAGKQLSVAKEGAAALSSDKIGALLSAKTSALTHGKLVKVDGVGDELVVSPTSSTRAEVAKANLNSQTAQAAVTTANAVNDSLGKAEDVLEGMKDILQTLSGEKALTGTKRRELAGQFSELAGQLDTLSSTEAFAGHKTLDGKFRATFTVGGETSVTIDATLPNGRAFSTEGLGLKGFAGFLQENSLSLNPSQGETMSKGLDIAQTAVSQVRSGLSEAATSAVGAMAQAVPLMNPELGGSAQTAQHLAEAARQSVLDAGAKAFGAQAHTAISSALRLLA